MTINNLRHDLSEREADLLINMVAHCMNWPTGYAQQEIAKGNLECDALINCWLKANLLGAFAPMTPNFDPNRYHPNLTEKNLFNVII